jgi:hypothetical protein
VTLVAIVITRAHVPSSIGFEKQVRAGIYPRNESEEGDPNAAVAGQRSQDALGDWSESVGH